MNSIEISARTVSEAVELALQQLGRDRDDVAISVLDNGDSGEALVRVTVIDDDDGTPAAPAATPATPPAAPTAKPAATSPAKPAATPPAAPAHPAPPVQPYHVEAPGDEVSILARTVLEELLQHLDIHGYVTAVTTHTPALGDDEAAEETITLHIEGADEQAMGLLIARRGETLQSVQFLVNLLVSRKTQKWPQLVVDVGNYRQRRRESLEGLARRMAERVVQSGRPITLEPMAAYERRIVHLALRGDAKVYTQSAGEGNGRKVIIYPSR